MGEGMGVEIEMEIWKPVPRTLGVYDVSNYGRVRTHHKIGRLAGGGILSASKNKKGYVRVHLSANGNKFSIVVHRLVLDSFVGVRPSPIHECNHKNGIKCDNQSSNLEWVTPRENNAHSVANGFWKPHKGENHGRAILDSKTVKSLRLRSKNETYASLAREFGVSAVAVRNAVKRTTWKCVS